MTPFQSIVALVMLVAATAKAAIVSNSSAPPFTVTAGAPGGGVSSVSSFPSGGVTSSVFGSAEPSGPFPTSSDLTITGSGGFSTVSGTAISTFSSSACTTFPTSVNGSFTTSIPVATSTAIFTFTYVPISTVTVTKYRCHKPTSVITILPTTTTARGITISQPAYTSTYAYPSGNEPSSSVTLAEPSSSATFSGFPEGTGSATSIGFAQPTSSVSSS